MWGHYLPPGLAGVSWAGECVGVWALLTSVLGGSWVGGAYLGSGRALRGLYSPLGWAGVGVREGAWVFGRYLPPGWAVSEWAGLRLAASTCAP